MEKVYKSKVAKWYLLTCILFATAFAGSMFLCLHSLPVLIIDVILTGSGLALMLDILFHTDYTIKDNRLHIRCGILYRTTLPICKISEISHKSTALSSPALSAKRIGIRYGRNNWVYISPLNQDEFIAHLKSVNPTITIA